MNLSKKSQRTYERLVERSNNKGRMPRISTLVRLLDECGIKYIVSGVKTRRWRENSKVYNTSDASRTYTGTEIEIPDINGVSGVHFDTTETYYSVNTPMYASCIVRIIDTIVSFGCMGTN